MGKADFWVHPKAICESSQVGARTKVWEFAHILEGATIGSDCNICNGVFIEQNVVVGDRVTVKNGVQLWDGLRLGDDVFVGPNATFSNDRFPRSKVWPDEFLSTVLEDGASIGANATILPGIRVGAGAMVGAGAVVVSDVPPHSIVVGNPARIIGYSSRGEGNHSFPPVGTHNMTRVEGVRLLELRTARDSRGALSAFEFNGDLPFEPKRMFLVYDVPSEKVRGMHAHKRCHQLLVAARGEVFVDVFDGVSQVTVKLNNSSRALLVPAGIWAEEYRFSEDACLAVLASEEYDPDDYIRSRDDYVRFRDSGNLVVKNLD